MAASLLGLGLALGAGSALAQSPAQNAWDRSWPATPAAPPAPAFVPAPPSVPAPPGEPGSTLTFHRDAPAAKTAFVPVQPPAADQGSTLTFHRDPVPAKSVTLPSVPSPVADQGSTMSFHRDALPPKAPSAPKFLPGPASIELIGNQKTDKNYPKSAYEGMEFRSLRELPGLEVVTRVESEASLKERMRQELLRSGERIVFPEEPVVSKQAYQGRHEPPLVAWAEPHFVTHGRLLFEQQNFERGLWDLGILGPLVSVGEFYFDLAMLPYHLGTRPLQQYDCSAGKCLPGDPSPFYVYPPEWSLTGLTAEAAVITGLFFIFP
jgi:hypothetical protein